MSELRRVNIRKVDNDKLGVGRPGREREITRSPTCSQSRSSLTGPEATASARDVVGRRALTVADSVAVTVLTSDDLPEPVAPAKATTVWSMPRARRS